MTGMFSKIKDLSPASKLLPSKAKDKVEDALPATDMEDKIRDRSKKASRILDTNPLSGKAKSARNILGD
jgi:hypothetical protein